MSGNRRVAVFSVVLAGCLLSIISSPALATGATYYVNCAAASDGNGSSTSPWNNLTTVNSKAFAPGDSLLFNRGTTCVGTFLFSSSGTSASPITIGAYGTGPLPAIDGTNRNRAVKLLNTSHVTMQDLEVKNSRIWGVLVTTDHDAPAVDITLRNLVVHNVTGANYGPMKAKWSGLVVFAPGMIVQPNLTKGSGVYTRKSYFDGVLVDNVTAYETSLWAGILVWGVQVDQDRHWRQHARDPALQSRNITIRNSTVHNTMGDGIAVYMSHDGKIRNNVVYRTGLEPPPPDIGTPVGLWWWTSSNMVGSFNESYDNHSPGVDGGGYDIDYWSTNSTMQYNYGHDNSTYCISVFGYAGTTTTNIVRYNVCAGNGRTHTYLTYDGTTEILPGQSEIYLCTWQGGKLADTWIYNNTFYVNSTGDPSATGLFDVCPGAGADETNSVFKNNLVVSAIPNVLGDVATANNRARDYNLYYYTGGTFTDPNREAHGIYNQNPLVNGLGYHEIGRPTTQWTLQPGSPAINSGTNPCAGLAGCSLGVRDFFGNPIPRGGAFDIGAHEAG
jgi:parallel beta-helix repeat protein